MNGSPPPVIDVHQHLWPDTLVEELRRRTRAPYLRGWTLHTASEPEYDVRPWDHDVRARAQLDQRHGIDVACVSLSAPLGIETLVATGAGRLLDAWHDGALAFPDRVRPWASVAAHEPDLETLAARLTTDFIGVQLPASLLREPGGWHRAAAVLEVAQAADRPVFVHPGPEPPSPQGSVLPSWWAPVVGYVSQLQAAWWAWHAYGGRGQFPTLRVLFAAGAGLAPVHHERYAARGGDGSLVDPLVYVDTSSYGRQGLDALVRILGIDTLVLGSDLPYALPADEQQGVAATERIRRHNPARLLGDRASSSRADQRELSA